MPARKILLACSGLLALAAFAQPAFAQLKSVPSAPRAETRKISGRIVDAENGAPLDRAQVAIAPVTQRTEFRTMMAGADGRFFFDNLVPGKYTLTAQRKGYLTQAFDQHGQYSSSIAVGPGLQSEDLVFRLRREASISGKVTDEQNESVQGAVVVLFQTGSFNGRGGTSVRQQAGTNDEGIYHFAHLAPGKYFVAVSAQPWYAQRPNRQDHAHHSFTNDGETVTVNRDEVAPPEQHPGPPDSPLDVAYPLTFYPGVTGSGASTAITISPGNKFTADVILRTVPALRLRVSLAEQEPGQGVSVNVVQSLLGGVNLPAHWVTSQRDKGIVEVGGLAPGNYVMNVNTGKNSFSRQFEVSSDAEVSMEERTL